MSIRKKTRTTTLLLGATTVAMAGVVTGCGTAVNDLANITGGGETPTGGGGGGTPPSAFSISGTFATTSGLSRLYAGTDDYSRWAANNFSTMTDYTQLIVSCVTFSVPPIAGTGGQVASNGKFTVTFTGEGAKGKPFGCFVNKTDFSMDPIPLTFVDQTKKSMDGSDQKTTRLAVSDSITVPSISLDMTTGTAQADMATIQSTAAPSQTGSAVLADTTGTKFNFAGEWIVAKASANGITVPTGYMEPKTGTELFQEMQANGGNDKGGGGPMVGMHFYFQRLTGHPFNYTNAAACATAKQNDTNGHNATWLLANGCSGTTDSSKDVYGISFWIPNMDGMFGNSGPSSGADIEAALLNAKAVAEFNSCKRRVGVSLDEVKAFGAVDLSSDPSLLADSANCTDGNCADKTGYYAGAPVFNNTIDLSTDSQKDSIFGDGTSGQVLKMTGVPPYNTYTDTITDGWKFSKAMQQWSMGKCMNTTVTLGSTAPVSYPAWKCYGKFDSDGSGTGTNFPGLSENAYQVHFGPGCYYMNGATKVPVQFNNWNDFSVGNTCDPVTTAPDGTAIPSKYWGSTCRKTFEPKDWNGNFIIDKDGTVHTAEVHCTNFGALLMTDGDSDDSNDVRAECSPADCGGGGSHPMDPNHWEQTSFATQGQLCSEILTNAGTDEAKKLVALQCYSNAYNRLRDKITGCAREVRLNWSAQKASEFVSQGGPEQARALMATEGFNYTTATSGTFTTQKENNEGVRSKNSSGGEMWINCRMAENLSITMNQIDASKMLVEFVSINTLLDTWNNDCVAAVKAGNLKTEKQQGIFVLKKCTIAANGDVSCPTP